MERQYTMSNAIEYARAAVTRSRDTITAVNKLIDLDQTTAAKLLLTDMSQELLKVIKGYETTLDKGYTANWLKLPENIVRLIVTDQSLTRGLERPAGKVFADILAYSPKADDLSIMLYLAVEKYRQATKSTADQLSVKHKAKSNRTVWAEYIGQKHAFIGKIIKFGTKKKKPTMLLVRPSLYNGQVSTTGHAWVKVGNQKFDRLRIGDIVTMQGWLKFYPQNETKIGIERISQLKVVKAGTGKDYKAWHTEKKVLQADNK